MKVIGKQGAHGRSADAATQKLMRLVEEKRFVDVEGAAREILARNGRHTVALRALTFALLGLGRGEEVLGVADRALKFIPGDAEIRNNRAIALSTLMRWDDAIADFQAAIRHSPTDFEIYYNLGSAYARMQRWNDAVPPLLKAIELHPDDYLEAVALLVTVLANAGRLDEAIVCCRSLCEGYPDRPQFLFDLVAVKLRLCEWDGITEDVERLRENLSRIGLLVSGAWFGFWFWFLRSADHMQIGTDFALHEIGNKLLDAPHGLTLQWRPGSRRLRLGYFSADFRNHAVSTAIAELLERHHREQVEVFAYSLGEDDGSPMRARLVHAVENFVDMSHASVHATAERIRADGIDVLVDLTGWMAGGRVESLALRCAPIQVSWLGYAGTLGHRRLADYIIGDPIVTPMADQAYYAETIAQMPHSYMPADTTRQLGEPPTRQSQGLPDEAFVLCSFNNSYKFNPPLFDLWCALLRQMPDAVLWLPRHNDAVAANLRKEFVGRGLAGERLILAERIESSADHLSRLQLADLALDTFPYNSHSTGVDTLWAGVPLVAKLGEVYASRVGASLLEAVGLPELIAIDDAAYGNLVLALYRDRPRLASLRERLRQARTTAPLFDMEKFAHDLENLYFDMARRAIAAAASLAEAAPGVASNPGPAGVSPK